MRLRNWKWEFPIPATCCCSGVLCASPPQPSDINCTKVSEKNMTAAEQVPQPLEILQVVKVPPRQQFTQNSRRLQRNPTLDTMRELYSLQNRRSRNWRTPQIPAKRMEPYHELSAESVLQK